MDLQPSDHDTTRHIRPRRQRQEAEILRLLSGHELHRAADLAHEHMAEFPDDDEVRRAVKAALDASTDPHLRRRAGEFT